MTISAAQVDRFRARLRDLLGLALDDSKLASLAELLDERAARTHTSPDVYLASGIDTTERSALARQLTVTETYFFRSADQLRAFADLSVGPAATAHTGRALRVLSAGCASGEEAYSIAMLAGEGARLARRELSIRGIDVNTAMLERAASGRYSAWALRETPDELRDRWFRADGKDYRLDPAIVGAVRFEERNLADEDLGFWKPDAFDVVFCRNVLMYFSPDAARAVVARFARALTPGGLLFLGHAENLRNISQDFHLLDTHGTFFYAKKVEGAQRRLPDVDSRSADRSASRAVEANDDTWIETIRRATARIDSLGGRASSLTTTLAETEARASARSWDLGPARELLRREEFAEARAVLGALPPESSRDTDVLLLRAVLLTHGGDLVEAAATCDELLKLDEMSAGAHYVMALCREAAGDLEGAASQDRLASHLDPGFAMPRLHLGRLARRAGDREDARAQLERALVLLDREDASRVLLFGGGFRREALAALCRAELAACGGGA